jgi:CMP-N,N'-diacetyllegionaminic acid synthase
MDHTPPIAHRHESPPQVIGVIPARGGSKGLPRKNLRLLGGLPLIVHTIRAAQQARLLDLVVVSTEDPEIAQVAREAGATVVDRPPELATDVVQNTDVVRHVLGVTAASFNRVVLLQPTSPLRGGEAIDACLKLLDHGDTRSAMTVTTVDHPPGKTMGLDESGAVQPFTNWADMEARRQDLPVLYRQNGAVYALRVNDFLAHNRFIVSPCRVHLMSAAQSVDIDTEFDLQMAEKLLESGLNQT